MGITASPSALRRRNGPPLRDVFNAPEQNSPKKAEVLAWLQGPNERNSPTSAPYIKQPLSDSKMELFIKNHASWWDRVNMFARLGSLAPEYHDADAFSLSADDKIMLRWLEEYYHRATPRPLA